MSKVSQNARLLEALKNFNFDSDEEINNAEFDSKNSKNDSFTEENTEEFEQKSEYSSIQSPKRAVLQSKYNNKTKK